MNFYPYKTIKILSKEHRVKPFPPSSAPDNRFGQYSEKTGEIHYDAVQDKDQLKDTILHEVLHGVDFAGQIGLKEKQVAAFATLLLAVFRENPELVKWLLR